MRYGIVIKYKKQFESRQVPGYSEISPKFSSVSPGEFTTISFQIHEHLADHLTDSFDDLW
jgi:hypothetical protein